MFLPCSSVVNYYCKVWMNEERRATKWGMPWRLINCTATSRTWHIKEKTPSPSEYSTGISRTHLFMSPKWATAEQEVFLEDWYAIYQQLKYRKKRPLFKEFWISLMADWSTQFGGTAADNGNETKAPSLEKVSCQRLHNTWNRQRLTN